jgi:hypothetical protein
VSPTERRPEAGSRSRHVSASRCPAFMIAPSTVPRPMIGRCGRCRRSPSPGSCACSGVVSAVIGRCHFNPPLLFQGQRTSAWYAELRTNGGLHLRWVQPSVEAASLRLGSAGGVSGEVVGTTTIFLSTAVPTATLCGTIAGSAGVASGRSTGLPPGSGWRIAGHAVDGQPSLRPSSSGGRNRRLEALNGGRARPFGQDLTSTSSGAAAASTLDASVLPPFLACGSGSTCARPNPRRPSRTHNAMRGVRRSGGGGRRTGMPVPRSGGVRGTRRTFRSWGQAQRLVKFAAGPIRRVIGQSSASRRWSEPAYCREYGPARCPGASGGPFSLGGPVTVLTANESPECHPPSVDLRTMSSRVRSRHGAYVDVRIPLLYGRRRPISAPNPRSATRKSG